MKCKKPPPGKVTTIRFNTGDLEVIGQLKKTLGITATTELVRLALRTTLKKSSKT